MVQKGKRWENGKQRETIDCVEYDNSAWESIHKRRTHFFRKCYEDICLGAQIKNNPLFLREELAQLEHKKN